MSDITLPADTCEHMNFSVKADIGRLTASDDPKKVSCYMAELRVTCTDCGTPFRWIDRGMGMSPREPLTDVEGLELRAPIWPSTRTDLPTGPGFSIGLRNNRPPSVVVE